jgi:hypothetical protein
MNQGPDLHTHALADRHEVNGIGVEMLPQGDRRGIENIEVVTISARRQVRRQDHRVEDRDIPEDQQDRQPGDHMSRPLPEDFPETPACALHRKMPGRFPRFLPTNPSGVTI